MAAVLTQEGAQALWRQVLGLTSSIGIPYLHLIGQTHVVAHQDTQATLAAVELVVSGYAPLQLVQPSASWQLAFTATGAQAAYPVLNWSLAGACTVFGYWLSDSINQYSLWGETFAQAVAYPFGGPFSLQLVPTLISSP